MESVSNATVSRTDPETIAAGSFKKVYSYSKKMPHNLKLMGAYYNGKSRVYYHFAQVSSRLSYSGVYNIEQQRIQSFKAVGVPATEDDSPIQASEVFQITENQIFWYILTNNRIEMLVIDSRDNTGKFQKHKTKTPPGPNDDVTKTTHATLAVIAGYPYLAGGFLGTTGYHGRYVALLGLYSGYWRYYYLQHPRDNPIIQRFRNKIYYIGGNRIIDDPLVEYGVIHLNAPSELWGANYVQIRQNSVYLIENYPELNEINNIFAAAAAYRDDLYIFTKKTFLNEGIFYRYNTFRDTFTLYKADRSICLDVDLDFVDSIKVTNVNNLLQITLSYYHNMILRCEIILFRPHF